MAHLRIAHLMIWQPDSGAAGLYQCVGIGMPESIHHRGAGSTNGVVIGFVAVAPAIQNGEYNRGHRG